MTMTIPAGELRFTHRPVLIDGLCAAWRARIERRAHRLALRRAGRLGPRLMADMGLDPETIRAVAGGWDELRLTPLLLPTLDRED